MPSWVKDEKKWEKAKKQAGPMDAIRKRDSKYGKKGTKKYPDEDAYWATVTTIYKNMGGEIGEGGTEEGAAPPGRGLSKGGKGRGLGPGKGKGCSKPDHTGPKGKLAARVRALTAKVAAAKAAKVPTADEISEWWVYMDPGSKRRVCKEIRVNHNHRRWNAREWERAMDYYVRVFEGDPRGYSRGRNV